MRPFVDLVCSASDNAFLRAPHVNKNDHEPALNCLRARAHARTAYGLTPTVSAKGCEGTAPVSFAQQRLWLLDRLLPSGAVYNVGNAWRLVGTLDVEALRWALSEVVRRHEVLRTTFGVDDGEPVQKVAAELELPWVVEDLERLGAGEREAQAQRLAHEETRASFDLARGPLVRARLLRLGEAEHWLLLTLHHIVTDGWSMRVLWRELSVLYAAHREDRPSPLPELPVQYADYAVWQREWLQGERLREQVDYWKAVLAEPPVLELPTDRLRPVVASYRGGQVAFELDAELTQGLKQLGRREGATLFMVLLAAFQVLLYRYSGQEDVAVGVPIAGRVRPELEGLIGFLVNTLVLRGDLSGAPSFVAYLGRVRARALGAYAHSDVPFEKLVEELHPERDLSRNPLFQASLVLQNTPPGALDLTGLQVQQIDGACGESAKFDLDCSLTEAAGRLQGSVAYAADLFDAATVERMVEHFRALLDGIVADPECSIARLPLLTVAERRRLVECNDAAFDYPRDTCVHQWFERQARRDPDAVAVVFGEARLTYGELNARANQLAHHLRTLGVGPEVLVAIALERSLDLIVGMLGILKAGGAYVPLDPGHPVARLAYMLEDSRAPVLLTQAHLNGRMPAYAGHTLCLDLDWPTIATRSDADPPSAATADNLAYVIYTSGSTGQPKGVMITHHNVVRLFRATHPWFGFNARDVWTCFHSAAFDFAVWEIWGALLHGGRLVVVPYLVSRDPDKFHALLRQERVTVLNQTPSAFSELAAADARTGAGSTAGLALQLVIFGGEALEPRSLRAWFDRHADTEPQLVNMYGITETCVHVTYRPIRRADLETARGSMIGKAIPDLRVHVLDGWLQPVPIGVAGEIVVGGAGVARGYLNRPALTAERFVVDPFVTDREARLYRSGDVARRTPEGDLEYLGRIDEQVKIRGFRIETGEIEAALTAHPAVSRAVVTVFDHAPGDRRLAAYVLPGDGRSATASELRTHLRELLPDYMIPASFTSMDRLPLTPNGKVDRRNLPAPHADTLAPSAEVVPPRDAIEVQVMRIWEALLGRYPVGVQEDFFELGGHSLLAAQVVDRVNQLFDRELPLDVLWHGGRTVATMAALLRAKAAEGDPIWSRAVPIKRTGARRAIFCAPVVGGHLYFYDNLARYLDPSQPVYGLPAQGIDSRLPPHTSVEGMAAHAIRLMREVQAAGPYSLLGYCSAGLVAFEMARQLEAEGEAIALLALVDTVAPGANAWSWASSPIGALRGNNRRLLQERIYHAVLHPLGLERLRRFNKIGEAHRWAVWSYRPGPFGGKAVLLRPSSAGDARDPALGWRRLVRGGVEVRTLGDRHGALVTVTGAARLATELARWLE